MQEFVHKGFVSVTERERRGEFFLEISLRNVVSVTVTVTVSNELHPKLHFIY